MYMHIGCTEFFNEPVYIKPTATNDDKLIPACPLTPRDVTINLDSKEHKDLQYCLFEEKKLYYHDHDEKEEQLCEHEVKPVMYVVKDTNNESVRCGSTKHQFLHHFGYYVRNDEYIVSHYMFFCTHNSFYICSSTVRKWIKNFKIQENRD